jgi:hypothetical protein
VAPNPTRDIAPRYTTETYDLLTNNCNNFRCPLPACPKQPPRAAPHHHLGPLSASTLMKLPLTLGLGVVSNEAVTFLLGEGIPNHILDLPETVFSSPGGMMLRPLVEQVRPLFTKLIMIIYTKMFMIVLTNKSYNCIGWTCRVP